MDFRITAPDEEYAFEDDTGQDVRRLSGLQQCFIVVVQVLWADARRLCTAVQEGVLQEIQGLLRAIPASAIDTYGYTALHYAARSLTDTADLTGLNLLLCGGRHL